jgi:peptide/nickel transport system ATP-binding protein
MSTQQDASDDDEIILECRNLCVSYYTRAGEIPAVVDFNLTLRAGESVGLVGESGCGKTTVAMAIMQYLGHNGAIVSGDVFYKGRNLKELSAEEIRRLRGNEIAMVYQEPMSALNPSMPMSRQLMEVPLTHEPGITEDEARQRAIKILEDVDLPDPERVMRSYVHQLSGGQQQRVVIAMALLANPSLLLLDEPTTGLDVTVEAGIVALIGDLSKRFNTSIIYVSHNLGLILDTCDRVYVMYSGDVVEFGSVEDVFDRMRHPYTHGLFNCIPLPGADKNERPLVPIPGQLPLPHERPSGCNFGPRCEHFTSGACDTIIPLSDVAGHSGHSVRCTRWDQIDWGSMRANAYDGAETEIGGSVLAVEEMQKYYELSEKTITSFVTGKGSRFVKANERVSFDALEGQTVAIVGESGCGKSTLAKVIVGLETASEGSVIFKGEDVSRTPTRERTREQVSGMQMVFQNPFDTLNPSYTVGTQLARVVRMFGDEKGRRSVRERVRELLALVKLPPEFANYRPRQLSGGQKQRIGIARAFAGNPWMVVADEPVSALDVSVAAAVTSVLMDTQRQHGTTLLFISHDLSLVRYLADRVVVMYLGHVMEHGTTDEIFSPPYHPYTEALLSAVPIADTSIEKKRIILSGLLPSAIDPPKGCPFHTRCHRKIGAICETKEPPEVEFGDGHTIACHIPIEDLREMEPVIVQKAKADAVPETVGD